MDEKRSPRTAKEALIAEMIGDMDNIISRLESIPSLLESSEDKLINTVEVLDEAGHRYKKTIITFTEQAKKDLQDFFDLKNNAVLSKTVEEQRAIIQTIANDIFQVEIADRASKINTFSYRSLSTRIVDLFFTSLGTAIFMSIFLYFLKLHK